MYFGFANGTAGKKFFPKGRNMQAEGNLQRIRHIQPFSLNDFPGLVPYGGLAFHQARNEPAQRIFERFSERVIGAVGKQYLPVYRMADGEFALLVGWRSPYRRAKLSLRVAGAFRELSEKVSGGGIKTCWGEAYRGETAKRARTRMIEAMSRVAESGILAAYFAVRPDGWGEQYIAPVCKALDSHGIVLSEANLVPFYAVYALLSGPCRERLLEGKRILVVTSLHGDRPEQIRRGLLAAKAASVDLLAVSPGSSMFDQPDSQRFEGMVDLVLVAAGIGSVNVLDRLRTLSVPVIDCGIALECFMDSRKRGERPFLKYEAGF
jgi:hypothetical protein